MIGLGPLGSILAIKRLRPVIAASLLGRLPLGMASVALIIGVQTSTGSVATAGVVAAGGTIGAAVGAPVQGRLLDRRDRKRVLACFAAAHGLSLVALALGLRAELGPVLLTALSVAFGLSIPSLSAANRWVLRTAAPDQVSAAFALEAALIEFVFIVGPAVAAAVAVAAGPEVVLLACALMVWAGTAWFLGRGAAWLSGGVAPEAEDVAAGRGDGRVVVVVMFVVGMGFLATVQGFLPIAVTQFAVERGGDLRPLGIGLSIMSVCSLIGGLGYGSVKWRLGFRSRFVLLALGYAVPLLVPVFAPGVSVVYVALAFAGLFLAPLTSLCLRILDAIGKSGAWMQTQSWGIVANTAGAAMGSALGGVVTARYGSASGFLAAALAVAGCVVVAAPAFAVLRRMGVTSDPVAPAKSVS
ncbi:MFS transporter [Amycolatopsis mediterranei]|uniref:MFS transporter n=1 Tax=Amycolatopsis mediterranei TaxID=33910 RepID=UPI003440EFA5